MLIEKQSFRTIYESDKISDIIYEVTGAYPDIEVTMSADRATEDYEYQFLSDKNVYEALVQLLKALGYVIGG